MIELNPRISVQLDVADPDLMAAAMAAVPMPSLLGALAALDAVTPMRSIRCVRVSGSRPQAWRCVFESVNDGSFDRELAEDVALTDVATRPLDAFFGAAGRAPTAVEKRATASVAAVTEPVCTLLCAILRAALPFRILVTYPQGDA